MRREHAWRLNRKPVTGVMCRRLMWREDLEMGEKELLMGMQNKRGLTEYEVRRLNEIWDRLGMPRPPV